MRSLAPLPYIRITASYSRDKFYSEIFKKYYVLLFTLCLCAIPATRFVIELFVSESYKHAWRFTGFLYLGAAFSALSSFLGMGFLSNIKRNSTEYFDNNFCSCIKYHY